MHGRMPCQPIGWQLTTGKTGKKTVRPKSLLVNRREGGCFVDEEVRHGKGTIIMNCDEARLSSSVHCPESPPLRAYYSVNVSH